MVALGFSRDTKMAILLKSVGTERLKDSYAARGASLYAFAKMSIGKNASSSNTKDDNSVHGGDDLVGSGDLPGAATGAVEPGDLPKGDNAPVGVESGNEDSDTEESSNDNDNAKWTPAKNPYSVTIGDRDCEVYLSSENGKININGLSDKNREFFVNFLKKIEIDISDADTITDSILDWLDPNDLTHINGAEDSYYGSLPDPYKTKDAPFTSIEELALIQGVTPEIFETIRDYITVFGDKQISVNVNLAPREILSAIPGLSDDIVDELYLHIEENGTISGNEELKEIFWGLGIIGDSYEDVKRYLTFENSDFITISAFIKGSARMQKQPDESSEHRGYDYKLIVGKDDNEYKIYAAYPE
jgi:hypothetical protein